MLLSLTIVTPEKKVVKDYGVEWLMMPAADGEVTILPGHTPLLTILVPGTILAHSESEDIHFLVTHGFAEIRDNKVSIFAEILEPASQLDLEKAEKLKVEVEQIVLNTVLGELEYAKYMKELQVAHKRVEIAKLMKDLSYIKRVSSEKKSH